MLTSVFLLPFPALQAHQDRFKLKDFNFAGFAAVFPKDIRDLVLLCAGSHFSHFLEFFCCTQPDSLISPSLNCTELVSPRPFQFCSLRNFLPTSKKSSGEDHVPGDPGGKWPDFSKMQKITTTKWRCELRRRDISKKIMMFQNSIWKKLNCAFGKLEARVWNYIKNNRLNINISDFYYSICAFARPDKYNKDTTTLSSICYVANAKNKKNSNDKGVYI